MTTFEAQAKAQPEAISTLTARVENFLQQQGVDARATYHVAMLIEELMSNLAIHGSVPDELAIVRLAVDPADVRVELLDRGPPFDPRCAPEPDLTTSVEERQVGGLGLFLMRKFASDISYARSGAQNCTRFSVRRSRA
ncbi:MAG TPA: ATP-binding protein [Xanthobacteraceae bacterium]|nr:ATP-binding protein [Xanthobacteraceae bacterium]